MNIFKIFKLKINQILQIDPSELFKICEKKFLKAGPDPCFEL